MGVVTDRIVSAVFDAKQSCCASKILPNLRFYLPRLEMFNVYMTIIFSDLVTCQFIT